LTHKALQDSPVFSSPRWWVVVSLCFLAVGIAFIGRIAGPSDVHDQTQPKTIAYTTNIVLNSDQLSRWMLPVELDMYPATKPPLYNWLAVPAVAITNGTSEFAHKIPSVAAFFGILVIVWCLGQRLDAETVTGRGLNASGLVAPTAVMIVACNYAFFKLSYLARPDTLLTLWLVFGWAAATSLVLKSQTYTTGQAGHPERIEVQECRCRKWGMWFALWGSIGLAAITKGPAAFVIVAYIFIIAVVGHISDAEGSQGSPNQNDTDQKETLKNRIARYVSDFRIALHRTGFFTGIIFALLFPGLWLFIAWIAEPDHVYNILIREEVIDRILGIGDEGTKSGSWDLLRTAPNMPLYFLTRFLPWSIFFVGAAIDLFAKPMDGRVRGFPSRTDRPVAHRWVLATFVFPIVVVIFFSLAAGKRADYIASAYVPASLLISYWFVHLGFRLGRRFPTSLAIVGVLVASGLIVHDHTLGFAARFPLSNALTEFADDVRETIAENGVITRELVFYETGTHPVQALLHCSQVDTEEHLRERLLNPQPFWLVARTRDLNTLLEASWLTDWVIEPAFESVSVSGSEGAPPYQVILISMNHKAL